MYSNQMKSLVTVSLYLLKWEKISRWFYEKMVYYFSFSWCRFLFFTV